MFCSTNITNVTGRTLFHFYFGNHVSIRTRRDVINTWNDLLCEYDTRMRTKQLTVSPK
jgi:hypothetical protein